MAGSRQTFERGVQMERAALAHLQQHGLQLLAQNWRSSAGELDLVMQDGDCLVFVEVRYRRTARFGSATESVDHRKQQRLARAASAFLCSQPRFQQAACRFDVIAISGDSPPQLEWIRHAFHL